ncbi:MAG TPA: SRPBCC family protein [Terriglobales bacterium]|nr:SRPBCC family protein [Terriglobales bacterium]
MPDKHYKLRFEQWIPVPIEQVFNFFSNPNNLPRIMPAWMHARVDSSELRSHRITGTGAEIVFSFRIFPGLPFRRRWTAKVVEFEPLHHFCDEQVSGPFAFWRHCHHFQKEDWDGRTGTRITDEIKYSVGFGLAGRIMDRLLIRPQLKANFDPRQEAILKLLVKN